ncbi:hypothetical protein [Kribbella sp. HUAS MG21]|uniref:Uncharacterized protein n=1 Tax=Kribbella sp. HUAS MG21 TaxID=3160966 RepID=A0AAU7TDZ4_9ACTN
MARRDAARLDHLVQQAASQLRAQRVLNAREFLVALHALADSAVTQPTDHALALFVNRAVQRTLHLPIPVRARAVVEATFATRDLVHALHRTPPHLTLVLHPFCAQLYHGSGSTLTPITGTGGDPAPSSLSKNGGAGAANGFPIQRGLDRSDSEETFLRRVDDALGRYRQRHPAPLIVAGHDTTTTRFLAISRNTQRLAATITGSASETPAALHTATRTATQNYLLGRQSEAMQQLANARATTTHAITTTAGTASQPPVHLMHGAVDCWLAAHHHTPVMLAVEETYVQPARITPPSHPGGWLPAAGRPELLDDPLRTTTTDPKPGPDEIPNEDPADPTTIRSDLIDDLIEIVISRGGWVALVDDGRLEHLDRVALITRPHQPRPEPRAASGAAS